MPGGDQLSLWVNEPGSTNVSHLPRSTTTKADRFDSSYIVGTPPPQHRGHDEPLLPDLVRYIQGTARTDGACPVVGIRHRKQCTSADASPGAVTVVAAALPTQRGDDCHLQEVIRGTTGSVIRNARLLT